ncbi:MAG: glycosyltransferase family 4 protein [Acidobacteriia bacterium]|nr:glycosyltransferase family 4 protein [Terriglobia bacterium]
MRILHLDAGREMRGGQWQVLRLIDGLAAAGVESTLLARAGAPLFEAARKQGCRVEGLGLAWTAMLARKHDLVHAHDARGHTFGAMVPGRPLVVSRRVAFAVGAVGPRRAHLGSRWKYGRAARYIAVSEFVKSVLIEGGVPEEKISVVYDGVPVLEQGRQAGDLLHDMTCVLSPANAGDPRKGAPLALEAARLADVNLQLSSDLDRDLRHAAVFVYVTHSEGLGSGVLLAMSAGVPVVASRVGGLPEVICHGENGLLVDNEPGAIAAAIRELVENPGLARSIGSAARQTVIERFTVNHMVRRTMEVYRQVLK